MADINREVESIMSRGFSRDHAVKIFFANHSDLQFDPNASYNFDGPSPYQGNYSDNGSQDPRSNGNGHNGAANGSRPQFQQPRNLAPVSAPQSQTNGHSSANKASPTASLQKMSSLSLSSSTQQTQQTTSVTTKQEMLVALSKSEDEEEVTAPARTLTRLASVSAMPLTDEDEAQIQILIGQGYPRVVATQMYRQKGNLGGLNKKVLQSNMNLNDLLAVPQASNNEGQITLADYGIDPNSREGQQIAQSGTPVPVPMTESSPRVPLSRRPSQVMNGSGNNSGDNSPYIASAGASAKYGGAPPPSLMEPLRRPSAYEQQQQYAPSPATGGSSNNRLERRPSTVSMNSNTGEYTPTSVHVQSQEMRRVGSFTNGQSMSPEERETEIQVLMHAGYARPVATEMVRQRRAGGGLDENILEADISTHNYAADLRPNDSPSEQQLQHHQSARRMERKASGAGGSLARTAVENSYDHQSPRGNGDAGTFQQQQQFTKPVTRKTSSGTLSNVTTEDHEREEDQRQIELMMSRGYTEEQARRATGLRRENLRQQAVETRTLESRTRSNNALPRQTSSSSNAGGYSAEPSPRGEYGMPTRTLPNNSSQSSMSITDSPHLVRRGSSARSNDDLTFEDQAEVVEYQRQGFTEDQAVAMVRHQKSKQQQQLQVQQPQQNLPSPPSQAYYSQATHTHHHHQSFHEQRRESSGYRDSPSGTPTGGNTRHMLQRTGSITVPPAIDSRNQSRSSSISVNADDEALRIGLLISEQDAEFGCNMYQTVTVQDEPEILRLVNMGYSTDDAVYLIFQRTHRSRNPNAYVPVPLGGSPAVQRRESSSAVYRDNGRDTREYNGNRDTREYNSNNNSPSPEREEQRKKGFFHRPSFLKKLSGSGKDWNDNRQSPQKSTSSKHHHHHQEEEKERYNRYNDYTETPEEREMRLRLRYREEDVEKLTELSFTREQAIQALVENHNNYDKALTMLLRS